jgi:tetratricopeptide (TPR) repeat protein
MAEKRLAILKRANKLSWKGKNDAAIKEYQKILAFKPDDLEVRRIVGDLYLRENNIPDAIVQFEWIADYYLKEGFFAKAIAMYKRVTRVDPTYEGATFKLAELYTKQGLIMEAKQIYLDIAEECKRNNNQKKALDMYKKILEFDRSNIKMRLLLADNYLKEGLEENSIEEYVLAADILITKKDYQRAEDLLLSTLKKLKSVKIIEKLVRLYMAQEKDDKAIQILNSLGDTLNSNLEMLKVLGELYLKKEMMLDAEKIFTKIAEINPEETEVIMRLGKVYLQREEYESTFNLFLPIIDKNILDKKYEEAASLLRFIIASENTFLPALTKLASIFKLSGKTNNLIALYESLIPIYEQKNMKDQLKKILEELIELSDTPFSYEEQLAKLTGQQAVELEEEEQVKESEREREFVNYNLRVVEEAIDLSDFDKAIDVLKKAKISFPKNIEVREKLFEIFNEQELKESAVEEGKGLLELYKFLNRNMEYSDMVEKLSRLRPHDDQLVALSGDEKTSIDINFDREELAEQIQEINAATMPTEGDLPEEDVLLLSDADNVTASPLQTEVEAELATKSDASKSLSSVLSEVDFYVNDGYFGDAEKLIEQLKKKYPANQALLEKIEKLNQAKESVNKKEDTGFSGSSFEIEHEGMDFGDQQIPAPEIEKGGTERIKTPPVMEDFVIETSNGFDGPMPDLPHAPKVHHSQQDSNVEIDLGDFDTGVNLEESPKMGLGLGDSDVIQPGSFEIEPDLIPKSSTPVPPGPPPEPVHEQSGVDVFDLNDLSEPDDHIHSNPEDSKVEIDLGGMDLGKQVEDFPPLSFADDELSLPDENLISTPIPEMPPEPDFGLERNTAPTFQETPLPPPMDLEPEAFEFEPPPPMEDQVFEIETSISQESSLAQEHEDSKLDIKINPQELVKSTDKTLSEESFAALELEAEDLEIEVEEEAAIITDPIPDLEIDKSLLIMSPSADSSKKGDSQSQSSSVIEELDLDSIMEKEDSVYDLDSPFKDDMTGADIAFEHEEDLLQGEGLFLEEEFLEVEKSVLPELTAIGYWLKELEKQRTSTIEKNMMEIFEEFKKGVDEKIGQEDYDTRYNLGIAYKEMGLLEEAIHEFLISAKHPMKFFDSAGLLGMCFREKGMFSEANKWFEQALETSGRQKEEYLAIRFELVVTLKLKEDYLRALSICQDIIKEDPSFRNTTEIYNEIKNLAANSE